MRDRAIAAQAKRDWTEARDLWQQVLQRDPDDAGAWVQLGNMLNELTDFQAALHAFDEALKHQPAFFDAVAGKAGVHERAGAWRSAHDAWLHASSLTTDEQQAAHVYSHAVLSAYLAGDGALLSRTTVQAAAAVPGFLDHADNTLLRARLLRADRPDVAKDLLRGRLRDAPGDDAARFEFASICLDEAAYADGLTVLETSLAAGDVAPSFIWLAADLYERLHEWRNVVKLCERALSQEVTELRFVQRAFEAALHLNDLSNARRFARRFTVMANGELTQIDRLREAYEAAGEIRRASLLCRWIARRWSHSQWHLGQAIRLTAASSGLLAADRLTRRTIAKHGRSNEVDRAYCLSALTVNEPSEAHRRLKWYLADSGRDDLDARVALGYVLANSMGIDRAEEHFLSLASSTFQMKGALIGLAHMALRRRDPRVALERWARVTSLYPDDTVARVEHARSVYNYGDHAGARRLCESRLRTNQSDITMGEFYFWLLVATGDDEAATAYFSELVRFSGPSWDALDSAVLLAGRLNLLERDWLRIRELTPSASNEIASGRLYHVVRLLMYFEKPSLANDLIELAGIDRRLVAWLAPYVERGLLIAPTALAAASKTRWRQVAAQVTDAPARRLEAMSSETVRSVLLKPAHEQTTVHIVNKFEQPRGGSELHALDLAARLGRYANVELWAPEMPHPHFSSDHDVQAIDPSQGRCPKGGTLVLIGIYFPITWIAFARPERIIFLYNTFEAPALYGRVTEAAALTGRPVELLFCSDLIGVECGLPGLFEPSPIDIGLFSPSPSSPESSRVRPFTLGRHSRDVMEKHHLDDVAVYQAVSAGGGRSVVVGGVCMRSAFQQSPTLELLPARTSGIAEFLRGLDVFFYRTSTWVEPWGRVVVEAMACEVAVLVHDLGGYAQIIQHEENGLLFHTTEEAVTQVKRLQADPALRRRLARAGRSTVENLLGDDSSSRLTTFYLLGAAG